MVISEQMHTRSIILFFLLTLPIGLLGQTYAGKLGSDWSRASERVEERREAWSEVFRSLDVDATECEAIIFPEQLRFSRLQDGMEQAALHGLYVTGGKERANFSIGLFQMKPSFVEQVEAAWMKSPLRHEYRLYFDLKDHREQRRRRLERMQDEQWQCVYLALFVKLLDERLPELAVMEGEERIRLLATAYNMSFTAPLEELQAAKHRQTFHLDLFPSKSTEYYEYAGIAVEWYRNGK